MEKLNNLSIEDLKDLKESKEKEIVKLGNSKNLIPQIYENRLKEPTFCMVISNACHYIDEEIAKIKEDIKQIDEQISTLSEEKLEN